MRFIICTLLCLLNHSLHSQKVVFYENKKSFYTNMENHVRFYVKDGNGPSLVFKTDNGKIEQTKFAFLIFSPARPGNTLIKIYQQKKNKLTLYDSIEVMVYENDIAEAFVVLFPFPIFRQQQKVFRL